jgi:hypothetical protein
MGYSQLVEPCGPCGCYTETCGHNCTSTHCEWAFGFDGACGVATMLSNLIGCSGREEAIEAAFRTACAAAKRCACESYKNFEWKKRMNDDMAYGYTYQDAWACIAEICRTGSVIFACGGSVCSRRGYLGWYAGGLGSTDLLPWVGRVHLCIENHYVVGLLVYSLANTMLHEMLHKCGLSNWGTEYYPDDPEVKRGEKTVSATSYIANRCISEYVNAEGHGEIIAPIAPFETWPKAEWE